jgi:Ala-tRNA(Pro) deacylase
MAKSIIIKLDGEPVLLVLPAGSKVDFRKVKQITGAKEVELAREEEMEDIFPDCKTGAMPPFGNLYHMSVFADKDLIEDEDIAFNGGDHRELVKMHFRDFNRLVHPKIYDLHRHPKIYI